MRTLHHFPFRLAILCILCSLVAVLSAGCGDGATSASPAPGATPSVAASTATPAPPPTKSVSELRDEGVALFGQGDYSGAAAIFTELLELDPDDPKTLYNLGLSQHHLGDYTAAVANLQRAIELDPQNADAHTNLGNTYAELGDFDQSLLYLEKATQLDPESFEAIWSLAATYMDVERYPAAIPALETALALDADYSEGYYNLGIAHYRLGDVAEAATVWEQGIMVAPDYAMMHTNLGRAYFDLGNLEPAEKMLTEARDLDPEVPLTHFNLGLVYRAQGAVGPAIETFETFLTLAPPDDPARSAVESALEELQAEVTGDWTEVVNEAGGYTISGPPTWVHVEDNARVVFARSKEDVDHLIDGAPMVMVEAWSPAAMMEDLGLDTLDDPAEVAAAAATSLGASHGDIQTAALGGYPAALVDIIGTYQGTQYYGTLAIILLEDRVIRVDGAGPTDQWPDVYATCIDMINSLAFAE